MIRARRESACEVFGRPPYPASQFLQLFIRRLWNLSGMMVRHFRALPGTGEGYHTPIYWASLTIQYTSTVEEQQKYLSEADMYAMENHWLIWGPKLPQWWALQPWVKGYSGEMTLGHTVENDLILSRLWIDSALKEAMQN